MKKKNKIENTTKTSRDAPILTLLETALPGGIEAQEARGTQQLAESAVLPSDGLVKSRSRREHYAKWAAKAGITIGDLVDDDPLFVHVTLPDGWRQECTGHSMWNDLLDEKGRKRAAIFYKAAFYDRSAHIHPVTRFHATYGSPEDYNDLRCWPLVIDCDKEIWRGEIIQPGPLPGIEGDCRLYDEALSKARQWLVDNGYPHYRDDNAYWGAP
jgi:hypothetical protein